MCVIYRVWVDVEVFDTETEETETVEVDFGPSMTVFPVDDTSACRAAAMVAAKSYAERLHLGRPLDEDDDPGFVEGIKTIHDEDGTEVAS